MNRSKVRVGKTLLGFAAGGVVIFAVITAANRCGHGGPQAPAPSAFRSPGEEAVDAERFADVTERAGIDFIHSSGARGERHLPETLGSGAAWLDFDGDGLLDLYLVTAGGRSAAGGEEHAGPPNRLFRNLGGGAFREVPDAAGAADRGHGIGVAVGDYDNDGDPDLYIAKFGENSLYRNDGGRFARIPGAGGAAGGGISTSAAFLDFDRDGFLDLYVCRYVRYDPAARCARAGIPTYCGPAAFPGEPDLLYRNRGDGSFEDASAGAGVAIAGPHAGKGLGVVALDFDLDGDTDIYVANDQCPNFLLRNNGSGTFTEIGGLACAAWSGDGQAQAGMGVDAGDFDLDGLPDIIVANFADEPNTLYRNRGGGGFDDLSAPMGIAGPTLGPLGFGVVFTDFDLDGDLDLYFANGHIHDNIAIWNPGSILGFAQPDLLLENRGGRGFRDISAQSGPWFRTALVGRGLAAADFDEDGDEDLFVLNQDGPGKLLENRSPRLGRWAALRLRGTRSNRDAYGALVAVEIPSAAGGTPARRLLEVRSARSYASACDSRVRIGLGPAPPGVRLRAIVRWPAGGIEAFEDIPIERTVEIVEARGTPLAAGAFPRPPWPLPPALAAPPSGPVAPAAPPAAAGALPRQLREELDAVLREVNALRDRHRPGAALARIEAFLAARPGGASDRDLQEVRAGLLVTLERPAEAATHLDRLLAASPDDPFLLAKLSLARAGAADPAGALDALDRLAAAAPDLAAAPPQRLARARALLAAGRAERAIEETAGILVLDPWLDEALLLHAEALSRAGRTQEAAPLIERYRDGEGRRRGEQQALQLEQDGRPAEAELLRGELEIERGRLFQARDHFLQAILARPGLGNAFIALARISERIERQGEGLEALERLPPAPEALAAQAALLLSMERPEEAARRYRAAIDRAPPDHRERGRWEEARGAIERGDLPGEAAARRAARAAARAGQTGRAVSASIGVLVELARSCHRLGDASRARDVALFAAETAPSSAEALRAVEEIFDAPGEVFIRRWARSKQ